MINYGLKLWSVNEDLFDDAVKSINNGYFDFIELYVLPGKFNKKALESFLKNKIKISLHAPHSLHGFNPMGDDIENTQKVWGNIKKYIDFLDPFNIVLHPEVGNDTSNLLRSLEYFDEERILIENMPKISSIDKSMKFYAYSLEHIKELKKYHRGFCFDFSKAKSSANARGLDIVGFINDMIHEMRNNYFHISGFLKETKVDEHLDLWEGDRDLMKWMKSRIIDIGNKKDIFVVFECKKKDGINNDLKNLEYFKSL